VIIGGIRTSTVWVVGTATLATPVGATGLGNYIFAGLQTRNWLSVTLGCIAAAALAVLLDRLIRTIEIGLRERRLRLVRYAGAGLAAIFLIGVAPAAWQAVQDRMPTSSAPIRQVVGGGGETAPARPLAGVRLTIGGKPYTEQYVLAAMLEQWLEARGARVERRDNLGSSVLFEALTKNSVDVAVDFSGTLWANIMERDAPIGRFAMITEVADYLWDKHGVLTIGPLGYENTYAVGVKPALARRLGLGDLRDFGAHAGELTIASDLEFQGRPEWPRLKRTYALNGIRARAFDSALLYQAIDENQVDAIVAYTTDGRLDAYDLRLLADPLEALPPYDAMLLLSPEAAAIPGLAAALAPLVGALDEGLMRAANGLVDVEGRPVEAAARFLLREIARRREVPPRDSAGTAKRIESGG
jgi:osmoprotectant transport system permease protein